MTEKPPQKSLGQKAAEVAGNVVKARFEWDMNMSLPAVLLKGVVYAAEKGYKAVKEHRTDRPK